MHARSAIRLLVGGNAKLPSCHGAGLNVTEPLSVRWLQCRMNDLAVQAAIRLIAVHRATNVNGLGGGIYCDSAIVK